jgi:hypothetical protein
MVIEEGNRPSDAVIVVEPIRTSTHTTADDCEPPRRTTERASGSGPGRRELGSWRSSPR